MFRFFTPFLLFVSWLLSLLVSVSVPLLHTIYLWDLKIQDSSGVLGITSVNVTGDIKFGLWGYCVSRIKGRYGSIFPPHPGDRYQIFAFQCSGF
jgi:hypothetical protein